jgi:hypothetical protein
VPRPARSAGPSLVAILCIVFALELILRRCLVPLVHVAWLIPAGPLRNTLDFAATASYYAATVLGCGIAVLALARLVVFPSVVPRGAKAAVGALAAAFMPLLLVSAWDPLPGAFQIYLQTSFSFLILLSMLAGFLTHRAPRTKIGLLILAIPILLYSTWSVGFRWYSDTPPGWARFALWSGEAASVAAAALMLPCYMPRTLTRKVTVIATATIAEIFALVAWKSDIAPSVSAAFGLQFPLATGARFLFVVALWSWLLVVAALLAQPGPLRLRGYGLLLVGLSGYQHEAPYQLAGTMVGFLCIVESMAREDRGTSPTTLEMWRALVKRVAAAVGARAVEVNGAEGYETARVNVTRDPDEIELTVGRSGGTVSHAELVVGYAPSEEAPPVALTRRGSPKLGRTKGEEVATGDLAFDEAFRIYDSRQITSRDRVLDDDLRPRLMSHLDGWLAVWPGTGVRYRTRDVTLLDEGTPKLTGLIDLLVELKNRS